MTLGTKRTRLGFGRRTVRTASYSGRSHQREDCLVANVEKRNAKLLKRAAHSLVLRKCEQEVVSEAVALVEARVAAKVR